jgi:thymidylate kinase
MAREFRWLAERTEPARVAAIAAEELGAGAADLVGELAAAPPTVAQLRAFRSRAAAALSWDRVYGAVEGRSVRLARALFRLAGGVNARYLRLPLSFRRAHRAGGCVVAFLGMDGSGKSTVAAEVRAWLAWKLDVYPVYFGSGAGTASALRWPMKILVDRFRHTRVLRGLRGARPEAPQRDGTHRERRVTWAVALWALALAREKRAKLKRLHRARSRGMIVVCDRYPQIQVAGYNDGPLLGAWLARGSGLQQRLARWEDAIYRRATLLRPDLVVKLDLPPEVAARRKPEMALEELRRRRQAVRAIHYEGCAYAEIDASAPLEEVLVAVKRAIWEQL